MFLQQRMEDSSVERSNNFQVCEPEELEGLEEELRELNSLLSARMSPETELWTYAAFADLDANSNSEVANALLQKTGGPLPAWVEKVVGVNLSVRPVDRASQSSSSSEFQSPGPNKASFSRSGSSSGTSSR